MSSQINSSAHFIVYHEAFRAILGPHASFQTVIETNAHEGPVYVASENALYFTTVPAASNMPLPGSFNVEVKRLDLRSPTLPLPQSALTTVRAHSNMANGMTLGLDGQLLICEQGTKTWPARISRLNLSSHETHTVVDQWRGLRFNSPNDIVVKRDGSIWFTDPSYGALQGFKDAPMVGDYVYRFDPATHSISVVADSFNKPNGLAFSPDESILYINDSGAIQEPGSYYVKLPHHIRAFDVKDGKHLVNDRLFAVVTPGIPDGLKVDSVGNVYSSSASGVQVFDPQGILLGEIIAPGVANFCFGGAQNNVLYLMADTVIWAVQLAAKGAGCGLALGVTQPHLSF